MAKSNKTIDEIREELKSTDQQLVLLEEGLKRMEHFIQNFEKMQSISNNILKYYHSDWDKDVTTFHNETELEHFESSNQDSIWNTTQEFYRLKIELLKKITQSL